MKNLIITCAIAIFSLSASAQKIVLIEQFSNAGCPPCATQTPLVTNYATQNSNKVAVIVYHVSFPYLDSMYNENPADNDAAEKYYGVQGVPYTAVDGNVYNNFTNDFNNKKSQVIDPRAAQAPKALVSIANAEVSNGKITGSVSFEILDNTININDLVLKTVVVEAEVNKSDYQKSPGKNAETVYHYVMRKHVPSFEGTTITATTQTENISWELNKIKNINQLRVIAYLQNKNTKEIYETVMATPSFSAVGAVFAANINENAIKLFPNPTSNTLTINYVGNEKTAQAINIYNVNGQLISTNILLNSSNEINVSQYASGTYLATITNANGKLVAAKRWIKE